MKENFFNDTLISQVTQSIETLKTQTSGPYYAAFDADGTLWDSDIGEQFFQYQIDHCQLAELENRDPWGDYHSMKKKDPRTAYLWLAQINQGHSIAQVREWAAEAVTRKAAKVFESQKKLIHLLQKMDIEVFIVTASIQWAVEPAAKLVNVPFENVLGVKTKLVNGVVSAEQDGPITWRDGKATALLERTKNIAPVFCSGNTYGDIALLETSQGLKLCTQTQTKTNSLYEEEKHLLDHAKKNNWLIHRFFN